MIPYMVGKLAPNSSHLTRELVKYVPGRSYFRAVPSQNGDKYVTFPPPQIVELVNCTCWLGSALCLHGSYHLLPVVRTHMRSSPAPGQVCPESICLAGSRTPPVLSLRPFPSWFCSHVRACQGWKCSAVESSLNAGWVKPWGLLFVRRARMWVGVGRYK